MFIMRHFLPNRIIFFHNLYHWDSFYWFLYFKDILLFLFLGFKNENITEIHLILEIVMRIVDLKLTTHNKVNDTHRHLNKFYK